jgi:hypothetical protein
MVGYDWLKGTSPYNSDINVAPFSQPDATTAGAPNGSPLSPLGDGSLAGRVGFQSERAETRPVRELLFNSSSLLSLFASRLSLSPLGRARLLLFSSVCYTLITFSGYDGMTFSHIRGVQ